MIFQSESHKSKEKEKEQPDLPSMEVTITVWK